MASVSTAANQAIFLVTARHREKARSAPAIRAKARRKRLAKSPRKTMTHQTSHHHRIRSLARPRLQPSFLIPLRTIPTSTCRNIWRRICHQSHHHQDVVARRPFDRFIFGLKHHLVLRKSQDHPRLMSMASATSLHVKKGRWSRSSSS